MPPSPWEPSEAKTTATPFCLVMSDGKEGYFATAPEAVRAQLQRPGSRMHRIDRSTGAWTYLRRPDEAVRVVLGNLGMTWELVDTIGASTYWTLYDKNDQVVVQRLHSGSLGPFAKGYRRCREMMLEYLSRALTSV